MESFIILNYGIVIKNMIPFWAYDFGFSLAATKETLEPMVRMYTLKKVFFHFLFFCSFCYFHSFLFDSSSVYELLFFLSA